MEKSHEGKKVKDMADCEDKDSTHYFMCHMTQEEWDEKIKNYEIVKNYKFNKIKSEQIESEDSLEFQDLAFAKGSMHKAMPAFNFLEDGTKVFCKAEWLE